MLRETSEFDKRKILRETMGTKARKGVEKLRRRSELLERG